MLFKKKGGFVMKRKFSIILVLSIMFCFFAGIGQASTFIDMNTRGITEVILGEQIIVDVLLSDDGTGVFSGALNFSYDPTLVTPTSFIAGSAPAIDPVFTSLPDLPASPGLISVFEFGDFGGVSGLLATITFDTIAAGPDAFLNPILTDGTSGGWNDNTTFLHIGIDDPRFELTGASVNIVNPVPIPATMLLFGSSILGILGLRRSRKS